MPARLPARMIGAQQLHRMSETDPSRFMTQSITVPPVWHAPRQCHRFFFGVMTSDGSWSSWNGQSPIRLAPCFAVRCRAFGQPLQRYLLLQPFDFRRGCAASGLKTPRMERS